MIGWFVGWLERWIAAAAALVAALIGGFISAPVTAAKRATTAPIVRRGTASEVVDVRHVVLRPGHPRQDAIFSGDELPTTVHVVADHDGRVVGVATLLVKDMPPGDVEPLPALQLRGMAVSDAYRGTGLGARLLREVHDAADAPIWCNARVGVVPFYERSGWISVGEPFDLPPGGVHRRMWWPGA